METGEEVSSTSEDVKPEKPSLLEASLKSPAQPEQEADDSELAEIDDKQPTEDVGVIKVNGDLNCDDQIRPKTAGSHGDNESISSCETHGLDVADSSVTSSETAEKHAKQQKTARGDVQVVASSKPASAALSSRASDFSLGKAEKKQERSETTKKELSLVEKLALNSSITILRKETKLDPQKIETVPEGRVLRLRPIPKPDLPKPSPKSTSRVVEKSSSKLNPSLRSSDKPAKGLKRKHDETEIDLSDKQMVTRFQYRGFKKSCNAPDPVNKSIIKFNPFNQACRGECHDPSQASMVCSNVDCSSLQPEYAQYLGLQPLVKFKCSNCGMSTFQTMSALNAHKVGCMRNEGVGSKSPTLPGSPSTLDLAGASVSERKSTNIKLTRKVFLCSACGTYYELWNLFLHMREAHKRYICLLCLGMSSSPEKLADHLKQKHGDVEENDPNATNLPSVFYLLCTSCDKIFSEEDSHKNHDCSNSITPSAKTPVVSSETQTIELPKPNPEGVPNSTAIAKPPLKKVIVKKSAKQLLVKKETLQKMDVQSAPAETSKEPRRPDELVQLKEASPETEAPRDLQEVTPEDSVSGMDAEKPEEINHPTSASNAQCAALREANDSPEELPHEENVSSKTGNDGTAPTEQPAVSIAPTEVSESVAPQEVAFAPALSEPAEQPPASISIADYPILGQQLAAPLQQAKPKNKRGKKTGGRRKKPLTFNARRKKLKVIPPPPQMEVNSSGLLPNPLNLLLSLNSNAPASTEDVAPSIAEPPKESHTQQPLDFVNTNKITLPPNIFKLKLKPDIDSEMDSDDSQKLSLVVDESANNSDSETKSVDRKEAFDTDSNISAPSAPAVDPAVEVIPGSGLVFASEDIQPMALTLDDRIENVSIQSVLKECVRTSCYSCNYCRHAHKIAVNGKYLALHLLSEHRYLPVKNEQPEDFVNKVKDSLDVLENMYFNCETYDSTDPSIHVPYDQDTTFDCFQCNFAFASHKDLFAHKRKYHSKPLLLCIMCKTNFLSYSEILCHLCPGHYTEEIMFHNVNISFRCCFCRKESIPSSFRLMVHLRKIHHTCDICLEGCSDQQKLSTHLWKHKVTHCCLRCGISYASKPDITKHLFWKHGHESVRCKKCLQKKWPHVYHFCIPPTSFICDECSETFSKAVALKVHKRLHTLESPYACTECKKKFISRKLLDRHEQRHRSIELGENPENESNNDDNLKEEIINVTDLVDSKDEAVDEESADNKDNVKEKYHKKHKKDRKEKVIDPYDLPPLNLSSDSDSSDEDDKKCDSTDMPDNRVKLENSSSCGDDNTLSTSDVIADAVNLPVLPDLTSTLGAEALKDHLQVGDSMPSVPDPEIKLEDVPVVPDTEQKNVEDVLANTKEATKHAEGIWENFYKTNPQNLNLPYPLCAMKSEVAYGIIMGDHDYCVPVKSDPIIKDDLPTGPNLEAALSDDKMDEVNIHPAVNEEEKNATPVDEKKKGRSPKKRLRTPNGNDGNSSSSSDSSSESDSSSCTCGSNCSCSSSSSNSSSSSSDSDSSGGEDKAKQEKKRKRKERKAKLKAEQEGPQEETIKEEDKVEQLIPSVEEEKLPPAPVDPPIQESELETDESSTDEEFYDPQPGKIANQIIAEKRNQLILSVGPPVVNNTLVEAPVSSPRPPDAVVPLPAPTPSVKRKPRSKEGRRRKRVPPKAKINVQAEVPNFAPRLPPQESQSYDLPVSNNVGAPTRLYPSFDTQVPSVYHPTPPASTTYQHAMPASLPNVYPSAAL
ncbi:unnamed protein product, partial [Nesidiocoris tenuis]